MSVPPPSASVATPDAERPDGQLPQGVDHLVLYDGTCGFCDASIQWLLDHDTRRRFHFAPLQGEQAARLRRAHPELPVDLDSVLLVERSAQGSVVCSRSTAVLSICRQLPAPWSWLAVFSVLPRVLRDAGYGLVARSRYRIWGRVDACRLPDPATAARFLS